MKRSAVAVALLIALVAPREAAGAPPQGMPDPVKMSGIPRADEQLPPGVITVRCLDGAFSNPAIGIEVELELTAPDGTKVQRRATSAEAGRARFEGLEGFYGATVVARTTVAGQALESQSFTLTGRSGFAIALVAAPGGGAGGQPNPEAHGGQGDVPLPGKPFPMPKNPRGTIIVGALDLADRGGPIPDVVVTLTATVEGGEPIIKTATTDADGRAIFKELDTALPEGAAIVVSADLKGERESSQSFTLGQTGYAIVLTINEGSAAPPGPAPPPERPASFPPRADRALPPGHVRVIVIDGNDQPIADQMVAGRVDAITGDEQVLGGKTNSAGQAILEFEPGEDLLAQINTQFGGAPWTSGGFSLPSDSGALVILRVFQTTADRSIIRSALQIDVVPRENDFASVNFTIALYIDGAVAFWPAGGFRIDGPRGTRSLHLGEESKEWLVHDGETPWVDLAKPIPPGTELRLNFAAALEHDGSLELEWTAPFPLVDDVSVLTLSPELEATHGVAGAPQSNPHAGRDGGPLDIYQLGYQKFVPGVCDRMGDSRFVCPFDAQTGHDVSVVVEGLPIRPRLWPWTAWGLLGVSALAVGVALALRPRVGVRAGLIARRDALVAELVAFDRSGAPAARRQQIVRNLDRVYRQLEALR